MRLGIPSKDNNIKSVSEFGKNVSFYVHKIFELVSHTLWRAHLNICLCFAVYNIIIVRNCVNFFESASMNETQYNGCFYEPNEVWEKLFHINGFFENTTLKNSWYLCKTKWLRNVCKKHTARCLIIFSYFTTENHIQ